MKIRTSPSEARLILGLILPFWKSEQKLKAWSMLLIVLICNILVVYAYVELNKLNGHMYNALENKDLQAFLKQIYKFTLMVSAVIIIMNINSYFNSILGFTWRKWLTDNLTQKWMKNSNFYRIMNLTYPAENPDQRISQDLNSFANETLGFFMELFSQSLSLVSFSILLWNLSGSFNLNKISDSNFEIHGYLFWTALLYCVIGTYVTIKIGKPLIALDYTQEKFEANFRYSLIRVREKREEIALYNGFTPEIKNLQDCFQDIKQNFYNIVIRTVYLNIWRKAYANFDQVIPLLAAAPMYFAGIYTLGVLMQIGGAFASVKESLSIIVSSFTGIASWLATSRRLLQLDAQIKDAQLLQEESKIIITRSNKDQISCEKLTITTPSGKALLKNVNLKANLKDRIIITGQSGIGKSTLIRAIADLWPYGQGNIHLPSDDVFFVPQRPYLPISTLRNALIYPGTPTKSFDKQILKFLKDLKLDYLSNNLDKKQDWGLVLSLGEQQRIAIIRLLLHKPKWIVMDEPTSSLDSALQNTVFELLNKNLKDSAIITVAHTPDLKQYHSIEIDVNKFN